LIALWLVLGLALVYVPVPFQRKLAEGIHIPVCLLAALAVEQLWGGAAVRHRAWTGALLVLLTLPSNALFLARAVRDLRTNNTAYIGNLMPPLYLRGDQYAALDALSEDASRSDLLLCNSFLGSYAPSLAGTRVHLGHWAETLHFREKLGDLSWFLRAETPDAGREAFCRRKGITHVLRDRSIYDEVYYMSVEGETGPGFQPEQSVWLSAVFGRERVSIYRVEPRERS
jgi:hypothetical protein